MRDEHVQAFIGDARARTAVDSRRRRRWLRRQLDEDRTFEDVCSRAMAAGAPVDAFVITGRTHRGRLVAVGAEVLAVVAADGGVAYIARSALVGLRQRSVAGEGHERRQVITGATLYDVVVSLADDGVSVRVGTADGRVHRGQITGVGRDVVSLGDGSHLRVDLVAEVIAR